MSKVRKFFHIAGGVLVALVVPGCVITAPDSAGMASRFRDADSASLIVRFRRWDNLLMLRPDSREGGYQPILTRDDLEARLRNKNFRDEFAIVVVPRLCWETQETSLPEEWRQLLARYGFRRFVILKTNGATDEVNGLPVVYDSQSLAGVPPPDNSALVVR